MKCKKQTWRESCLSGHEESTRVRHTKILDLGDECCADYT